MYLYSPGGGGGTGGVCGIMDRRVTDSEFNVKPLFNICFSPSLRRDIVVPSQAIRCGRWQKIRTARTKDEMLPT